MSAKPYVLGMTGSIGMGKSTTADFFRAAGVPVWDADAVVHHLYQGDPAALSAMADIAQQATREGHIDRAILKSLITRDPGLLEHVEQAIHPLVARDRAGFLEQARASGAPLVLCDIPLLFETGAEEWLDGVLVVSVDPAEQRRRVMKRPGMTEATFEMILSNQMPDSEKRKRADFVLETQDLQSTEHAVKSLVNELKKRGADHA